MFSRHTDASNCSWPYYPYVPTFQAPPRPSGVTIPDHSAARIAAAEAKRQRKANRKTLQP